MNRYFSTWKEELAHSNVAKGLAWLQESGPLHGLNWRLIGTFSPVHTAAGHTCPLAQASGPDGRYWTTLSKLRRDGVIARRDLMLDWAYEHGFTCGSNATGTDQHIPWRLLDDAWNVALDEARRLAA